jgi:hypothetical protein
MQWTEFGPYVLPFVSGCPEPVLEHHARLTAIDFCRRTLCDTRTLDPVLTNGFNSVEIEPATDTKIVKVKKVVIDGREYKIAPPNLGRELITSGSQEEFCFTPDNITLTINPMPVEGLQVVVTAALAPTLTAPELSDMVANEHLQDMAPGIVGSIMRIPNQPFTGDFNAISLYAMAYANRASTIAAKVARGMAGAKMRSYGTFV